MTKEIHPFERTIGDGPYRFIGVVTIHVGDYGTKVFGSGVNPEDVEAGIGTCAHCGMGIMNCFIIRRGDGKLYGVGSSCIAKSSLPYEVKSAAKKAELARQRAKREARKAAQDEKERIRFLAERDYWNNNPDFRRLFDLTPHPIDAMAKQGMTLTDYIDWNVKRMNRTAVHRYVGPAIEMRKSK